MDSIKFKLTNAIDTARDLQLAGAKSKAEIKRINDEHEKAKCKEVELFDLTFAQRVECETLISGTMMEVGTAIKITDPERYYQARTKLCLYGLRVEEEGLNAYSSADLAEISNEVLGRATAGADPTR